MKTKEEIDVEVAVEIDTVNQQINHHKDRVHELQRKIVRLCRRNNYRYKSPVSNNKESVRKLVVEVCKSIPDITYEQLTSSTRKGEVLIVRHVIGYLLHRHYSVTSTVIGEVLNRDHATILSSNKKIDGAVKQYKEKGIDFGNVMPYLTSVSKIMGI